jgi:hypothetical protein
MQSGTREKKEKTWKVGENSKPEFEQISTPEPLLSLTVSLSDYNGT